jgi:PAS domain S-box-containing protein
MTGVSVEYNLKKVADRLEKNAEAIINKLVMNPGINSPLAGASPEELAFWGNLANELITDIANFMRGQKLPTEEEMSVDTSMMLEKHIDLRQTFTMRQMLESEILSVLIVDGASAAETLAIMNAVQTVLTGAVSAYVKKTDEFIEKGFSLDFTEDIKDQLVKRKLSGFGALVFDSVNIWFDVMDAAGNLILWNRAAEEISGYSRKDVLGHRKIWDWLYPDKEYLDQVINLSRKAGSSVEVAPFETVICNSDGQNRTMAWNIHVLEADDDAAAITIAVGRDITDQRTAQKLANLLAHALESSREGVVLADMSGVITYVNPIASEMIGVEASQVLGKDLAIFCLGNSSPEDRHQMVRATLDGGWSGEIEHQSSDGRRFPAHLMTSLVRDEKGQAIAMVALTRDISREKSLQEKLIMQEHRYAADLEYQVRERTSELEQANRDLKRLDAAKVRFLSNISHELRTPLVTGVGYIEMILGNKMGNINSEIRNSLEISHRNLQRLVSQIEDLLAFTRLESRDGKMLASNFSLEQIVNESLLALKVRADRPNLKVMMEIEPGLPAIRGDEENIHRVFSNLLSNSEKFTGDDARVSVKAFRKGDDRVEVRIEDNGIGIPEDELKLVFDRFYRSKRSHSSKFRGTGIGLSIVNEILAAHKCEIHAESADNGGVIMVFSLPLAV